MHTINTSKLIHQSNRGLWLLLLAVAFLIVGLAPTKISATETNNVWNGTNGLSADIYWSDSINWVNAKTNGGAAAAGIPGLQGDVFFGNNGGTLTFPTPPSTGSPVGSTLSVIGGSVNDFTTNNLTCIITNNQTIHRLFLWPTNTAAASGGGMQNLLIASNVTLTVQGTDDNGMGALGDFDNTAPPLSSQIPTSTMYVGRQTGFFGNTLENNPTQITISGPNGTLFLNNTNNEMQVRDCNSSGGQHPATLDMSALANFQANLARMKIAMGEQNSTNLRAQAIVYLAMTNNFVLSGTNSGELDNFSYNINPQNAGSASQLYWGWSNGVYADTVLLSGRKSGGGTNMFNPNFANPSYLNTQPTPSVLFRSHTGGPVSLFRVGDEIDGNAGTASSFYLNYIGGLVNLSANTMVVGRGQSANSGGETLIFILGDGVVNANTLLLCSQGNAAFTGAMLVSALLSGTHVTVTNSLQMVVPFSTTAARTLNFGMSSDANGVPATLTTLGTVSTGFVTPHNLKDSIVNYNITNSTIAMVNPQPFEASSMILDGGTISNASYILVTGNGNSTTVNNAYGYSMTILDNGKILGSPIFDMGVRTANWDVSGIGGTTPGSLVVSNLLEGIGTIDGSVVQAPGATIQVGEGTAAGTLTISSGVISNSVPGNLTLNAGNLQLGLSTTAGGVNDAINVQGTLNLLGTNNVTLTSLGGSFDTANEYTLITSGSTLPGNAASYFKASGALGGSRYILTFDTTTSPQNVLLSVSGSGPTSDTWVGGLNGNAWDVNTTANWKTNGAAAKFFDLDNVTFDDTGSASPAISTSGSSLIPGSMTVNNTNNNYTFAGTGSILVGGAFTANGSGSVNFTNTGGVTFQDALTIGSNNVTLGNGPVSIVGDPNSQVGLTLNGGSLTLTGNSAATFVNPVFAQTLNINSGFVNIVNSNANVFNGTIINLNGSFVFGQPASVSAACDAVFSGGGQIIQNGPGLISLSAANSGLSGLPTVINGGTLQITTGTAAGGTGIIVNPGGTLDIADKGVSLPITAGGFGVGGQGAIVSSTGSGAVTLSGGLTLVTNVSVGGAPHWNFDPVQNSGLFAISGTLTASTITVNSTNAYNFTKVGNNEIQYNFSTIDPLLANIDVQSGMLYLEGSGGLGNPTNSLTVESGAVLALSGFNTDSSTGNAPTKNWILNGDGVDSTILDYGIAQSTIAGPVTLNGVCLMDATISSRVNNGNVGVPGNVEVQGPIGGTGSFNKVGNDTWILDATNTYTGNTPVSAGILELQGNGCISNSPVISIQAGAEIDVTERANQTLTLNSGQTLKTLNSGNVNGNLLTAPGSTLAPGGTSALDALSVANGNVTLAGVTSMKLQPSLNGSGVDGDQLNATNGGQSITFGGTLQLANFDSSSYAIGQSFPLFNATTYSGQFTSIIPAQPGSGLAWDTNALATTGVLNIISGPVTGPGTFTSPTGITSFSINGANVVIHGTNGQSGDAYYLLSSTNVAKPLNQWKTVATNVVGANGNYTFNGTNVVTPGDQQQFYILSSTNYNP